MARRISSLADLPDTMAYLQRIGAEPRSLRVAVIREAEGKYFKDVAIIRFERDGSVSIKEKEYQPSDDEAAKIKIEFGQVQWPSVKKITRLINPPPMIYNAEKKDVYEFRDMANALLMVQVRIEKNGQKHYIPWTYWDDGEWRMAEPEDKLPLFNQNKLNQSTTVFIHEGAKAARFCQELIEEDGLFRKRSHPWLEELSGAVHVGWIGGALSPHRTDWTPLAKYGVKCVYIVADNDLPGRKAIPQIAKHIHAPTFAIEFTDEFKPGFDLADPFPEKMFSELDGVQYYTGRTFKDLLHPATWATDLKHYAKGKPTPVLRESFRNMWAFVEQIDAYVCIAMPQIIRRESVLNKMLAPFSDTQQTTMLMNKSFRGRTSKVCYRPDEPGLTVTHEGTSAINLHIPSSIKAMEGDATPWLEFLKYMFPNEEERYRIKRWCATLIAKPEIHIEYGLLLVSQKQGIGKTTLGQTILGALVGHHNVSYPSEMDILSQFNDWAANKRLIVINELYSGSSWKVYHTLKNVISDNKIDVHKKYMDKYSIDNWCHFICCSNSSRPLKLERDDRRWYFPKITENAWPREKFVKLRSWLESGGLSIIRYWAENFGDYVGAGEQSPKTERKTELIEDSQSEAQRELIQLVENLNERNESVAFVLHDAAIWVRPFVQGMVFDSDRELKETMTNSGLLCWTSRLMIEGAKQYVMYNKAMELELETIVKDDDKIKRLRECIKRVSDLRQEEL